MTATPLSAPVLALAALAGLVLACACWFAMPPLVDAALKRRYRRHRQWFEESAKRYSAFLDERHAVPNPKARGDEGALGVWAADARRKVYASAITRERFELMVGAGMYDAEGALPENFNPDGLMAESAYEQGWSWNPGPQARFPLSLACFLTGALSTILSFIAHPVSAAAFCLFGLVGIFSSICDLRTRTIPTYLAVASFAAALAMAAPAGPGRVGLGAVSAICAAAGLYLLGAVFSAIRKSEEVGRGDMRYALSVGMAAPGLAFLCGGAASIAATLALVAAECLRRHAVRGLLQLKIPFGPVLALWGLAGAFISLACGV